MKKNLIVLISLMMAMNALAEVTWNGTSSTSWTQGAGTAASPYIISSPAHLKYLADQVSAGNTYTGVYFKQTQDFNLNSKTWTSIGAVLYSGVVISYKAFEGIYNGNNKYISNLKDNPVFGKINNTTILNLTIEKSASSVGEAALARETDGDCVLTNCHNKAAISGSGGLISTAKGTSLTLTGCSNSGKVTSTTAGGLIGTSQVQTLTITSCSNAGYIQASAIAAGGLVGSVESGSVLVDQCFSTGDAATGGSATTGHIVGEVKSGAACTVMRSYSKGSANHMMIGKCSSPAIVKGCYVVGGIGFSDDRIVTSATTISCYYVGGTVRPTSANYYSIAQWGSSASYCFHYTTNGWNIAGGTFVSKEDLQEPSFLARINKEEEYFVMDLEGINDGYPILKWQAGTRYKLTASCDANRGTVSGGGEYPNGYAVKLTATPKDGCMFVGWSDGNTDNPRTVTVSGNANYTAQFTKSSYTIYVNQDGTSNIE